MNQVGPRGPTMTRDGHESSSGSSRSSRIFTQVEHRRHVQAISDQAMSIEGDILPPIAPVSGVRSWRTDQAKTKTEPCRPNARSRPNTMATQRREHEMFGGSPPPPTTLRAASKRANHKARERHEDQDDTNNTESDDAARTRRRGRGAGAIWTHGGPSPRGRRHEGARQARERNDGAARAERRARERRGHGAQAPAGTN